MSAGAVRVEWPLPGVAEVVVDRPPLNILSVGLQQRLAEALGSLHDDDELRCLLVRGEGAAAFSVGADVKELSREPDPDPWCGEDLATHWTTLLVAMPCLTVACVNGHCLGGGLELALCTDVRIASGMASFGFPEVNLGLIPGMGGTARLPSVVGAAWAKRMILTGEPISADRALAIGLVQEVVEDPRAAGLELARTAVRPPRLAQRAAKRLIGAQTHTAAALHAERNAWLSMWPTDERQQRLSAFMARR